MTTFVSVLLLLVLVAAVVGLRVLVERAFAKHLAPRLRRTWLGLAIYVSICLGGGVGCFIVALNGLTSGVIHCFGRGCSTTYQLSSNPSAYWLGIALWAGGAAFFLWVTLLGIKNFARSRGAA